jgi:hypothetical protein
MGISFNSRMFTTHGSYNNTNKQNRIRLTKTLRDYDLQIIQNNQKIIELSKKINHTCSSYKPFIMQKSCHILYLDIEDITYDNRKIRMLKRDIYLRYGLDWDEDFN